MTKTKFMNCQNMISMIMLLISLTTSNHRTSLFFFENEFQIFKIYINKHLINDFIQHSQSSIETFILFVRKKNDFFKFCVDYRDLNDFIIKNRYSLFFINENLNRFDDAKLFTNFDFTTTYHRLRIKKKHE